MIYWTNLLVQLRGP